MSRIAPNVFAAQQKLLTTCGQTVTSQRQRYQTLVRMIQSTSSTCLAIITNLVCREGDPSSKEEVRKRLSELGDDSKNGNDWGEQSKNQMAYNYFYNQLTSHFPATAKSIELAVTTNIVMCKLESDVDIPSDDTPFVPEPIYALYQFLIRLCNERPILLMQADDARGTFSTFVQESMERFIAEQTRWKPELFQPPDICALPGSSLQGFDLVGPPPPLPVQSQLMGPILHPTVLFPPADVS